MFYGMPARIVNGQGKAIQGTLGFVGALLKIVRMTWPTHVAVLFDGEYESARGVLDGDYKANRPDYSRMPEEDTPFSQLPDIYAALAESRNDNHRGAVGDWGQINTGGTETADSCLRAA